MRGIRKAEMAIESGEGNHAYKFLICKLVHQVGYLLVFFFIDTVVL